MLFQLIVLVLAIASAPLSDAGRDNTERMLKYTLEKSFNVLFKDSDTKEDPLHYKSSIDFIWDNGSKYYLRGLARDSKTLSELTDDIRRFDASLVFESKHNLLMSNALASYSMDFGCHNDTLVKSDKLLELLNPKTAIRHVIESNLSNQFELCFRALKKAIELTLDLFGDEFNRKLEQHLEVLLNFRTAIKDSSEFIRAWTQHLQAANLDDPQVNLYNPDFGNQEPTVDIKRDRFRDQWQNPCQTLVDMTLNHQQTMQTRLMSNMSFDYMKRDFDWRKLFLKVEFCRILLRSRMLERLYPIAGQDPIEDDQSLDEPSVEQEQSSLFDPTVQMHPSEQFIPAGPTIVEFGIGNMATQAEPFQQQQQQSNYAESSQQAQDQAY